MKVNQKSILSFKAGLIVLVGLFGATVRASESGTVKVAFFPMPAKQEALYRNEFGRIWDSSMINRDRRKKYTADTFPLRAFTDDGSVGGRTFGIADLIAFPVENSSVEGSNSFTGKREHDIAHEFVHFAVDSLSLPVGSQLLPVGSQPQANDDSVPDRIIPQEFEIDDSPVGYNFAHQDRVREFYAELKGFELLQQRNPRAFNKKYHYLYTKCAKGNLDRNEGYPNPQEFLLCWSLYQQKKAEDSSTDLRNFIDHYLKNRDCYKAAIQSTQFLKTFQEQRESTLQGKFENILLERHLSPNFFMNGALAIQLAGLAVLCGDLLSPKVELSKTTATAIVLGSQLPIISTLCIGANKIIDRSISLQGRLYNSRLVWDKDKFKQALDKDATQVEQLVHLGKLTDGLELE